MRHVVWRIATGTPAYEANDLTGAGAKATGGRWNEVGVPVVYASESRALAWLETLVHLNGGGLPLNRYLVAISIPDDVWAKARVESAGSLAVGWDAEPAGRVSIRFGTEWVKAGREAVLRLPSVIIPEEVNVFISPLHPDVRKTVATKMRRLLYDPRLVTGSHGQIKS